MRNFITYAIVGALCGVLGFALGERNIVQEQEEAARVYQEVMFGSPIDTQALLDSAYMTLTAEDGESVLDQMKLYAQELHDYCVTLANRRRFDPTRCDVD